MGKGREENHRMRKIALLLICCISLSACAKKEASAPNEASAGVEEIEKVVEEQKVENEVKEEESSKADAEVKPAEKEEESEEKNEAEEAKKEEIKEENEKVEEKTEETIEEIEADDEKNEAVENKEEEKTETASQKDKTPDFAFTVKGKKVLINEPFKAYKAIGKEDNFFTAPSCAFDGKTNIYEYESFTISEVQEPKKKPLVFSVLLVDEKASTAEGVKIGDDIKKLKKVYGEPTYTTDASYVYRKGEVELIFIYDELEGDGEIISIEYRSTFLEKAND